MKIRLIAIIAFLTLGISSSYCQIYTVRNTNANGAESLLEAVNQAYTAPAGNKTIIFDIPVAASYVIGPINLNLPASQNITSLIIDATTQKGYSGEPHIILRGNGTGNCFNVGTSNLTIKGFIVQNYTNGYYQTSGSLNFIETCWFGLDPTGTQATTADRIKEYGIYLKGPGNPTVSTSDPVNFLAEKRNVIAGCGTAGIRIETGGAGSFIGNTFIGTDKTGTVALGNGTDTNKGTEIRHGIIIQATTSTIIKNNVISGNKSGGIDIYENSNNTTIIGNKIGTDITGNLPLGNRTFGLRIKESNGNRIGGTSIAERNIISANGSNDFKHQPQTTVANEFDWYNSCGIYLFNSSNNSVTNNYIGVDASGNLHTINNPYDLGNLYAGLKIDGNLPSNTNLVKDNVIGGNGFRSFMLYTQNGGDSLKGHGIIIKDATTSGTFVLGNKIGVGVDGTTRLGNKEDGISIQGAVNTTIGSTNSIDRNIISDNIWGVSISSNYYNSQAINARIIGNYIGTNASGTSELGNGRRAGNLSGGGIKIAHLSQSTFVQNNVISGNRSGISLQDKSPTGIPLLAADAGKGSTGGQIFGNLIGVGANGITSIPNLDNGLLISDNATLNFIGGTPAQANNIKGNGLNGIYIKSAPSNTITGNIISGNDKIGIGFEAAIDNTVRGNLITSNKTNGIFMQASSNGNKFFGNIIGDLTVNANGNLGDGINITGSSNNVIGGANTGEGNIIANNSGNGINMLGATSNNNAVHRNQISCNGLRGIELNGVANGNYAKPTFSGSETALVVTGPANSYIELYSLDGCNNCINPLSKKLQGRTLIASGNSPLNFAGTTGVVYTATASAANTNIGHRTSEFSDCYSLCVPSNIALTVTGGTYCFGNTANVAVGLSEIGTSYRVIDALGNNVSGSVAGTGATITIPTTLTAVGTYNNLNVSVSSTGCSARNLTRTATVVIESIPNIGLTVTGGTYCFGNTANVAVGLSEIGKSYRVIDALGNIVSGSVAGTGATITIPTTLTAVGTYNNLNVSVSSTGCSARNLTRTATVVIESIPNIGLTVTGGTYCFGNTANVAVGLSEIGKSYRVIDALGNIVSGSVAGTGATITIPTTLTAVGTYNNLNVSVSSTGCSARNLTRTATVVIESVPNLGLTVTGGTYCFGNTANVAVGLSEIGKSYRVIDALGNIVSGSVAGTGATITISTTLTAVGTYNNLNVSVSSTGCSARNLTRTTTIIINSSPKITSPVTSNSPICFGAQGIVTVKEAEKGKSYQVFDQTNTEVSALTLAIADGELKINLDSLPVNTYILTVKASVPGCAGTVNLTQTVSFIVNNGLNGALKIKYINEICLGSPASITIEKSENLVAYQAFTQKDDSPASNVVIGDGKDKVVTLFPLLEGTNVIYFKATIGGCGSVKLGNTATIKVFTDVKKGLVATATSPICLGDVATVKIDSSETDKTYEIFENKVSVSAKVPGNNGTININVPNLKIGDHKFTVNVTVPGCKRDTLLQNPFTKVNSAPDSTLKVGTNGPVCAGNQAVFYILKSQAGKKYQIFNSSTAVSKVETGNGDTLKIILDNLLPATYTLTARATADGCSSSTNLADKGTITINSIPEKGLIATVNGPVCIGNPAIVTVEKAEVGKSYQVYYNGKPVSAPALGNGNNLPINVNTQIIPSGDHPLSIGISVPGCTSDSLTSKPVLTINTSPDSSILVSAVVSPICVGNNGAVRISGIQQKVSYQAFIGADSVSQNLSGPGPDLILPIPANKLSEGLNNISVKGTIAGCIADYLADTAGIKVNPNPEIDLDISVAPDEICEGGESILTIATSESGVTYQAVVGSKTVSEAVLSSGGKVELILFGLALGDNIVGVKASVGGCLDKNLDSTVLVKVNSGPKLNYGLTGSTVCKGNGGKVTISGSEIGVSYEAFIKATNTSVSGSVAGTGSAITIPLNPSDNAVDTIIVKANVAGCGIVRLDSVAVVITNDPEVSKKLPVSGSAICINDPIATATVRNALNGVVYEASVGNNKLPVLTGNGTDLIFTIAGDLLLEGNNIVSFIATAEGCGPVALDSTAIVMVNNNNTSKDLPTRGSDICVYDVNGIATVLLAKKGISYQATINTTQLPEILIGNDADLTFTIPGANIDLGRNSVTFTASAAGCTPITMSNIAIINRNDNTTSDSLPTRGSTVCANDKFATVSVLGAKAGISYQAFKGTKPVSGKSVGDGSDLSFSLDQADLSLGSNVISFKASVAGCADIDLDSTAIVIVLGERYAISGSTLRCNNTEGTYSIDSVPGIISYSWTVPNGANILSGQGTNSISVAFGTESGLVTVSPVGSIGICTGISSELFIRVEPPFTDTINIIGTDTLCVGDANRIYVDSNNVFGVDRIEWTWAPEIQMVDTLNQTSLFLKFGIKHPVLGRQMIIATPHISCSDSYGVPDTLIVTVLAYPRVEAGVYPLVENDLKSLVLLDGRGSSIEGDTPNDSLTYKWIGFGGDVSINNPESLSQASFIPKASETTVYLTIKNHNMCMVTDSAKIAVALSIEIPNIFTPNADGTHDKWEIKNLHTLYPNCTVDVFNKWGSFIYNSNGYSEPWDGTRNGEDMPVATYYYVVDLRDGSKPRVGSLTIIR